MRIEPSFIMFEPSKIGMFSRNPLISGIDNSGYG
jgi:hypothetical protein